MRDFMRLFLRKNGWWYYQITRNRPKSLKTKDKSEAAQLYRAIKKRYLAGKIKELDPDKSISISEFKTVFLSRHTEIADDTKSAYELAFRLFCDSVGGSTMLSRAGLQIDKFKADCLARGCKKVSINTYLRHTKAILGKAVKWGYLEKRPEIELYRIGRRHPQILSSDEIQLLLLHSSKCQPEMHRIILFALWTGCRRSEIHGLRWEKIKKNSCTVLGKGNKERTIPLLPQGVEALGPRKDIGPVFWQPHIDEYSKAYKRLCCDCEIDSHFHILRHTAATQMLLSGISLESVQKLLGHTDISTTQIYAQVLQEKLTEEMQKFSY